MPSQNVNGVNLYYFAGAGHVPHISHPAVYVGAVRPLCQRIGSAQSGLQKMMLWASIGTPSN